MFWATLFVFFFALFSLYVSIPLDQCNIPPPITTLPQCNAGNWGQQICYSNTSFVVCNYNYWTVPLVCPTTTQCKPHPANPEFNIICDF